MAVDAPRPENPRHRSRRRQHGGIVDVQGRIVNIKPVQGGENAGPVERRYRHATVGALNRQEPVLQVGGVVILVHADRDVDVVGRVGIKVGVEVIRRDPRSEIGIVVRVERAADHMAVVSKIRILRKRMTGGVEERMTVSIGILGRAPHAGAIEGTLKTAVELEGNTRQEIRRVGLDKLARSDVVVLGRNIAGDTGLNAVVLGHVKDAKSRRIGVVVNDDFMTLAHSPDGSHQCAGKSNDPATKVVVGIVVRVKGVRRKISLTDQKASVLPSPLGDVRDRDAVAGTVGKTVEQRAVVDRVVAVHVAFQAVAADDRLRIVGVVDQLRQREIHQLSAVGKLLRLREIDRADARLPAERGKRHSDQGEQAKHPEDDHQNHAAAARSGYAFPSFGEHGRFSLFRPSGRGGGIRHVRRCL